MVYFALVIEWKDEPATLMECQLRNSGAELVQERMEKALENPRVVRVAMVQLSYVKGNDTLVSPDKQ